MSCTGKGPYDAEGGVVKYFIRRQILTRRFAFLDAKAVWEFARTDSKLCSARVVGVGVGKDITNFDVSSRHFYLVQEADLQQLVYSTSPLFHTKGAVGHGKLKTKFDVFCVRADANPPVIAWGCEPASLGFVVAPGSRGTTTPYAPATLNLIAPGQFTGGWRVYTCSCGVCTFGESGVCSFYGAGTPPPPWVEYSITRSPPNPGKDDEAFINVLIDSSAARWVGRGEPQAFAAAMGAWIRTKLRRFKSEKVAVEYVLKRLSKPQWVRRWVLKEHAAGPLAWETAHPIILSKLALFGWQPPVVGGEQTSAAEFVVGVLDCR